MKLLAALVLAVTLYWAEAADSVTYACRTATPNANGTISIRFSLDAKPTAIYAVGKSTSCALGLTASAGVFVIPATTDATAPFKYDAVIDTTTGDAATACGVTTTTSAPPTSTVTFFVQKSSNALIITGDDVGYKATCDWSSGVTTTKEITATKVTSNDKAASTATAAAIDATIEIFATTAGAGAQTAKTTITLQDTCSIRVTLNDIKTKLITKAKVHTVKASSAATFDAGKTVDLMDASGCGIAASGVFTTAKTFAAESTYNGKNPTKFQYKSDDFACFRFVGSNDLYVKATLLGCLESGKADCTTKCTKRRKRDASTAVASTGESEKTAEFTTFVKVLAKELNDQKSQDSNQNADGLTAGSCMTQVTFLSVIAILVVLLLLTLVITFYFGSRLFRTRTSNAEAGHPNMAYKA